MGGARIRRRVPAIAVALLTLALVGCESQSTGPKPLTASPTARAFGSPAAGESPKPVASRDPGQAALTKFFTLVTDDNFAYQATFTGESRHTADILGISKGVLLVSGKNVRVRTTFSHKRTGAVITVEHRYVGGRGWIKFGPQAWQRLAGFDETTSMGAFAAVRAPTDVTYVGPIQGGGAPSFRVSMPSVIVNPIMIPFSNLSDTAISDSKLELRIDAAGKPLSGTATITARGRISGQLQEIVIDLKLTFVKVGQKVTISAP